MEGSRIHSDDWLYVRFIGRASAEISERKFYLRTNIAKVFPEVRPLLDKCKLENVKPLSTEEIGQLRKEGTDEKELNKLVVDISRALQKNHLYYYDLLNDYPDKSFRQIMKAWSSIREINELSQDERGRYYIEAR